MDHIGNTVFFLIVQQYLNCCIEMGVCLFAYCIVMAALITIHFKGNERECPIFWHVFKIGIFSLDLQYKLLESQRKMKGPAHALSLVTHIASGYILKSNEYMLSYM